MGDKYRHGDGADKKQCVSFHKATDNLSLLEASAARPGLACLLFTDYGSIQPHPKGMSIEFFRQIGEQVVSHTRSDAVSGRIRRRSAAVPGIGASVGRVEFAAPHPSRRAGRAGSPLPAAWLPFPHSSARNGVHALPYPHDVRDHLVGTRRRSRPIRSVFGRDYQVGTSRRDVRQSFPAITA